jgi:hypothetical protein
MLKRPAGATVEQIMKATDWQPHTVRGFFAGALKKRLGIEVTSEKTHSGKRYAAVIESYQKAQDVAKQLR